jgi:hypothetical protein
MILIEYACKTDYQMIITHSKRLICTVIIIIVEKQHEVKVDELETKFKGEIERLEISESQHKSEARDLRQQCDELARAKKEEEKRREQVM